MPHLKLKRSNAQFAGYGFILCFFKLDLHCLVLLDGGLPLGEFGEYIF